MWSDPDGIINKKFKVLVQTQEELDLLLEVM